MEYKHCPTTCESDVEEDVLVLVEVPTGHDGRKRQIKNTRSPFSGWHYSWTMTLLCLVLTLILINDMNTYGRLESQWQREEAALELLQEVRAHAGGRQEVAVKSTMRIEIYYEVLCPDSRHFIMKQLTPAYEKLKDILQVGLVPYGKAETQEKNGKITFDCQHGPRECEGNIVHACVTNIIKDEAKQIAIVHCMIDRNEQPMLVGKKCVEKHGENWGSISSCVSSDKGISILKHMGQMTHRLKPEVSFIPTITIDGSQEDQKHILQDFHKVLCKRYKGPRHPSC
ncbi:gamma-interferon-inducible lysosomal thiol reductase-like isoform X2 [Penaeus japonicus]|uniref:gamma-interferon-inducible lysosomal thiol reductase-like isoform X2 n=1 Tax=Penaeus japonicus TaxID=27405 RepID=UPI001C70DF03|nr:gamma-interferon-inducible lysosomal thiol reductase-like isoform X2 [Penaeus japonicus]